MDRVCKDWEDVVAINGDSFFKIDTDVFIKDRIRFVLQDKTIEYLYFDNFELAKMKFDELTENNQQWIQINDK